MATRRPRKPSSPRYTTPLAPRPISRSMRYLPMLAGGWAVAMSMLRGDGFGPVVERAQNGLGALVRGFRKLVDLGEQLVHSARAPGTVEQAGAAGRFPALGLLGRERGREVARTVAPE